MANIVKYKVAIVSYLDILGFKNIVGTRSAGEISRIIRVFKEATQPDRFIPKPRLVTNEDFANFSDLMIISTPLENRSAPPRGLLFSHLLHLVRAQTILTCDEHIVIRGGVTIGKIVRSWGQLYGPAIVRAYDLESEVAKNPRIVVGREVLKEIRSNPGLWVHDLETDYQAVRGLLRQDSDREYFVDYLRVIFNELDNPETEYPQILDGHRALIDERLRQYAGNEKILGKYQWLDRYHAETLSQLHSSNA
jgi:hypothetical protein